MASSNPIARAQDIMTCGLCETEPKVKWKCLECRLLMCQKCCHKVHPKLKNAEDHQIIDVKEVGQSSREERSKVNLNNIKCTSHTKEVCCLHCRTCQLLVCPSCIAQGHKSHSFVEMQAFFNQMYGKLKDTIQRLELEEKNMDKEIDKLKEFGSKENLKYQNLLESIEKRENFLAQVFQVFANTLKKEATDRLKSIENSVSKEQDKIKKSKQQMLENKTKFKQILGSQDGNDYLKNKDMLTYEPPQDYKSFKPEDNQMPSFFPGNVSMDAFGSFQIKNRKITLAIQKTFTTEVGCCHYLAVCDNEKLWICQQLPTQILQKVSIMDNALEILEIPTNTSNKDVYDMKTFNNGLFISDKTPTLKILKTNDNVISESKFTTPDRLYIVGFDFTDDGKVVMATRSTQDAMPVEGRRVVVRMTSDGKQEMVCEYDHHRKRIFSCPRNICCTKKGNILVIDIILPDGTGKVICITYDGNAINTFNGLPGTTMNSMIPSSIISTPSDNVIVCDDNNNILYLLDNNGECLSSFDTASIGIFLPFSMFFTNPTTLYIGCTTENDSTEKAKLYEILVIETN